MDAKVTVCTVVTTSLWLIGASALVLISVGAIGHQHVGIAFLPISGALVLYVRYLARQAKERELAAFRLGQLTPKVPEGTSGLHAIP